LQQLLDRSIEPETAEKTAKRPTALLLLLFALVCAVLLPWGIFQHRSRIETDTANALDAAPELSVYRLLPRAHQGKLTLTGRVPNSYLRERAGQIALKIAPNLELDNQIIAVDLPPDPILTAAEVQRVTALFNQREGAAISSRYQEDAVTIKGIVPNQEEAEKITWGFRQISGVRSVTNTVQVGLTTLKTRIYFDFNSTELKEKEIKVKIQQVKEFLRQNPKVHLKIIGHSDPVGDMLGKEKLALSRARAVRQVLIFGGVSSGRLQVSGSPQLPPDVTADQPSWLSRCVRFEISIP
jgi:outer membrane protein OmpA-like peptidoglycan-associated protein